MNAQIIGVFLAGMVVAGGVFSLGRASVPVSDQQRAPAGETVRTERAEIEALQRRVEMLTQAMDSMGGTASLAPVSGRIPAVEGEGSRRRRPPSADAQGSEDPLAPRMIQLLEDDETFRERMREIFQADRQERREVNSAKRFARWMERLTTKLAEAELDGLSANQQADLEGILEEERQQVRSGFRRARRGELTWDEARDRAIKFREASNEKIKPILGDEQFAVFEEFRRRARGPR
ncbi:MAG: hypothetical protein CMH50_10135 [Myxococcales bacterium]|nr:hypothetical protein [Myxococcales bacterium]